MRQTVIRERSGTRFPIAETLWIVAGMVMLLAFGDVVIVLALALAAAAMTTAWWIRRNTGHRVRHSDVALASVSHLRAGHRGTASAHAPWHRPHAA